MNNSQSSLICLAGGWGLAALSAVLGFALLMLIGGWTFIQAAFAAIVIFVIVGALLSWSACKPLPALNQTVVAPAKDIHPVKTSTHSAEIAAPAERAGALKPAAPTPAPTPLSGPTAAKTVVKPSAALAGEADLAARKGTWRYEGGDPDPSPEAPDVDTDGDGVIEGKDEGRRPDALDGPREGKADNLKEIKGIGPKLEILCNTLGFYHFDQIANWSSDEIAWVDANLVGFKGRVTRDEWVSQAKTLAAGGDTEFSERVGDGDVY